MQRRNWEILENYQVGRSEWTGRYIQWLSWKLVTHIDRRRSGRLGVYPRFESRTPVISMKRNNVPPSAPLTSLTCWNFMHAHEVDRSGYGARSVHCTLANTIFQDACTISSCYTWTSSSCDKLESRERYCGMLDYSPRNQFRFYKHKSTSVLWFWLPLNSTINPEEKRQRGREEDRLKSN